MTVQVKQDSKSTTIPVRVFEHDWAFYSSDGSDA